MAKNITLMGADYPAVPAVLLPQTGGGTAQFDDTSDANATASDIANGKTAYVNGVKITGTASGGGGAVVVTDTLDANGGTIREITAVDISNDTVTAATLLSGYTAHDKEGTAITGTYTPPTFATETKSVSYTPSTSQQTDTITPSTGYDGIEEVNVTINAMPSGSASTPATTITANPSISVSSTGLITASVSASQSVTPSVSAGYVSSGTAGTISVSGSDTEQLSVQAATTITPTTSEQTAVSAGKYTTGAVKVAAMPSGTAGTPTATKGTVSNNSVSVTPSVTNTTGYITGSTKTGTAVTVSASELVSGDLAISQNGNNIDVTNYATVSVNVSGSTGKNVQVVHGTKRVAATAYTDVGYEITVAKTGTYNAYWAGWRSSTSGTNGAQLYVNGVASGSAVTTFDSSWTNVQNGSRTSVSLTQGDKVTLRARSRGTSYYMYIFFLSIEEV